MDSIQQAPAQAATPPVPPKAAACAEELPDADILSVLFDLFARRTTAAYGESLEWWMETLQCDLDPRDAAGVILAVLSKWPFDHRAAEAGVDALRAELVSRARMLIDRSHRDTGEAA